MTVLHQVNVLALSRIISVRHNTVNSSLYILITVKHTQPASLHLLVIQQRN